MVFVVYVLKIEKDGKFDDVCFVFYDDFDFWSFFFDNFKELKFKLNFDFIFIIIFLMGGEL